MNTATFTKGEKNMTVERIFNAPRSRVWEAWTQSGLLEQWWAPKPYRAVTESFDFREGGHWHYYMLGPDQSKQWCWASYDSVEPQKGFSGDDFFCDEQGKRNPDLPIMHWKTEFLDEGAGSKVVVTLTFDSQEDMEKIISMGFEEGFSQALGNLDGVLARS